MKDDSVGRLRTTALSRTPVTTFISWVLADVVIVDNGIPFLSVKICLFAWPSLLLSVEDYCPQLCGPPPKGDFIDILSMDCHHAHLITSLSSYSVSNLTLIFLKMSNWTHFWNRLWHVEPELYSLGSSIFHWYSVPRICMMPSITFLKGTIERPIVLFYFSVGNMGLISSHRLSEIFVMACLSFFCSCCWWVQDTFE